MIETPILIATTNKGKFEEISAALRSLHLTILSLEDISEEIVPPDEYGATIEENALIKARYYSQKTGHITIADDGGLFIQALNEWPGVQAARIAKNNTERIAIILEKMKNKENRRATFDVAIALYNPHTDASYIATGSSVVEITKKIDITTKESWGYNTILYVPEAKKTYAAMSIDEKSEYSHRGKALRNIQYQLKNNYGRKTLVCACSIIVQNNTVLLILRNDPHRPDFHRKWEFPGGGLDFGESLRDNVIRETEEETGYIVEPVHLLQHIPAESQIATTFAYQVVLPLYICKIVGGELSLADQEALDAKWVPINEVTQQDMVGNNAEIFKKILPELQQFLETTPL